MTYPCLEGTSTVFVPIPTVHISFAAEPVPLHMNLKVVLLGRIFIFSHHSKDSLKKCLYNFIITEVLINALKCLCLINHCFNI